jgi:methylated-DNA-[protein]-cysteine S-methyltransferase
VGFADLIETPLGDLLLLGDGEALTGLRLPGGLERDARSPRARPFAAAREQLSSYFAGELVEFELPLAPAGTAFQRRVWDELERIPYGRTSSYGELARRIGAPNAARAVGAANGSNPISIVIPCHRLVGAHGGLVGYAGGVDAKRFLLALEAGVSGSRTYTLIGSDGRRYESSLPGTLGGHRRNKVYGRLDCAGARRWIAKGQYVGQRVFFADEPTAIAAGYRPCAGCMPDRYRAWKSAREAANRSGLSPESRLQSRLR